MEIKINTRTVTLFIIVCIGIWLTYEGIYELKHGNTQTSTFIGFMGFCAIWFETLVIILGIIYLIVSILDGNIELFPEKTIKLNLPKRNKNKKQKTN